MKTKIIISLIALLTLPAISLKSQQQPEMLNLPGDNLNLYAVMKIFQESETFEIFEEKLNSEDSKINNLDLNGDGYIDYIKVVDYVEKNVHYIVLRVAVTPAENQDVAVFVVRKDPDGQVQIQLIGDEDLYGKYYIVEPYYDTEVSKPNPGYYGNYGNYGNQVQSEPLVIYRTTPWEIAAWPIVRVIFHPNYVVWHSPWYWGYYPPFWHPWTPWYWHQYYGYHYHMHHQYYGYYHNGHHYRHEGWHENYYGNHHSSSNTVFARRERGEFNATYSKPESMREGSDIFKRKHPDLVKPDMKDPVLSDIRTADKMDKQNDKSSVQGKTLVKGKASSPVDRNISDQKEKKQSNIIKGKAESNPGTLHKGNTENKPANVIPGKSENQPGAVKPEKTESKPQGVEPGKSGNKPESVPQERKENKVKSPEPERKFKSGEPPKVQTIQKEEKRSSAGNAPKENSRPGREETKRDKVNPSKASGKTERK